MGRLLIPMGDFQARANKSKDKPDSELDEFEKVRDNTKYYSSNEMVIICHYLSPSPDPRGAQATRRGRSCIGEACREEESRRQETRYEEK